MFDAEVDLPDDADQIDWNGISESEARVWGQQLDHHRSAMIELELTRRVRKHLLQLSALFAATSAVLLGYDASAGRVVLGFAAGLLVHLLATIVDAVRGNKRVAKTKEALLAAHQQLPRHGA